MSLGIALNIVDVCPVVLSAGGLCEGAARVYVWSACLRGCVRRARPRDSPGLAAQHGHVRGTGETITRESWKKNPFYQGISRQSC